MKNKHYEVEMLELSRKQSKKYWDKKMTNRRVNEEKLLNEMFVTLEYSDSFYEFISNLSEEAFLELTKQIALRQMKNNAGSL